MTDPIHSRPYRPEQCCEACVFGRGEHAAWCSGKTVQRHLKQIFRNAIAEMDERTSRMWLEGDWDLTFTETMSRAQAKQRYPEFMGIPVKTDANISRDELQFKSGDRVLGKIINIKT